MDLNRLADKRCVVSKDRDMTFGKVFTRFGPIGPIPVEAVRSSLSHTYNRELDELGCANHSIGEEIDDERR